MESGPRCRPNAGGQNSRFRGKPLSLLRDTWEGQSYGPGSISAISVALTLNKGIAFHPLEPPSSSQVASRVAEEAVS